MSIRWYIEKDVFPENEERLSQVLGNRLTFVRRSKIEFNEIENLDGQRIVDVGVFYGSIHLALQLQKHGFLSFLPANDFDCTKWLPYFGSLALNHAHLYVEAGCLKSMVNSLKINTIPFFVKQEKGYKTFSGQAYNDSTLELVHRLFPNELLLIAPIEKIGREFRFMINDDIEHGQSVIAQSYYSHYDEENIPVPQSALEFAISCINSVNYCPAQVWTLDVCEIGQVGSNQYRVVEPNSLLTAGWYNADIKLIVSMVDIHASKAMSYLEKR
jgi:hypothetical protein